MHFKKGMQTKSMKIKSEFIFLMLNLGDLFQKELHSD